MKKTLAIGKFKGGSYFVEGEGFPVVLVHGFPADHLLWKKQIKALSKRYRLILPDLPGTGASASLEPISIESMADFLGTLLVIEKIDRCVMIGHSMGGYVTAAFADRFSNYLKGWGLFHSSALADSEEKKVARNRTIDLMKKYGAAAYIKQAIPNLASIDFREAHQAELSEIVQDRLDAGLDALINYYEAMRDRPERTTALKESPVPVLFVMGKNDHVVPMELTLQQIKMPPDSESHIISQAGHLAMIERPKITEKILSQFVDFCISVSTN